MEVGNCVIDGLVGPTWSGRMSGYCLDYVLSSECASSRVIRRQLLECEELVESDHKGLAIEFEWRVDVRRCKWKKVSRKKMKSLN